MILRLHNAEDNSVILVHDEDCLIFRGTAEGKSCIRFKDYNFDTIVVNESPDKIYNLLSSNVK